MKRKSQTFWKTVKSFLADKKTPSDEKITLIEKDKIIKTDSKTAVFFLFYHH